jgi:NADPH-dependent curcumin reductase CurA
MGQGPEAALQPETERNARLAMIGAISGYSRSTHAGQMPWLSRLEGRMRRKSVERSQAPAGFRMEPQPQQMEMMADMLPP